MRRRNPVVLVFVGAAVVLAGLLVLASARRATVVGPATVTTAVGRTTVGATTAGATAAPGATAGATSVVTTAVPRSSSVAAPVAPRGMRSVRAVALPAEARAMLALVESGGPFPYAQDGAVFQNREGLLPRKAAGYYREYTVETPGSSDRGARRIVTGQAGERYYTDDHYETFRFVVP